MLGSIDRIRAIVARAGPAFWPASCLVPHPMVRILAVDDTQSSLAFVASCAREAGHEAVCVASGEAAMTAIEQQEFHLVLVDVLMPGINGIETCRRMRACRHGAEVPIVLMTGLEESWVVEEAISAGADDILLKPIRRGELLVRVRALLRTYDLLRRERAARELVELQNAQLQELSRQKDELSCFIVHDLKSPLASIAFTIQNLLATAPRGAGRDALEGCLHATESVTRMLLNVLDVNGQYQLRPVAESIRLGELVDRLGHLFSPRLQLRQLSLVAPSSDVAVRADPELLGRMLENLLDNAIRYAPRGTAIQVEGASVDGGTEVRVSDLGPGVPPEYRHRIFERFIQVEAGEVSRTSRGLGLAFCRAASEAHGGRIWVEDGLPTGAVFCTWFPGGE
jgi:two-component system, sensor histidine kinase and response regulator